MEAYQGYAENGRIIPVFEQSIPNGRWAIITVLDESPSSENTPQRQKKALLTREKALNKCSEALPPEFDEILAQRANLTRKIEVFSGLNFTNCCKA